MTEVRKNEFLHSSYPKLTGKVAQAARMGQLQELVPESVVGEAVIDGETIEYPMLVRSEIDPPVDNQYFGAISFVLADEPRKLSNGSIIYGLAKLRGNWADADLAKQGCTKIIRTTDSKYPTKIAPVGKWIPIIKGNAFTKENIDVPVDDERVSKEKVLEELKKKREKEKADFDKRIEELKNEGDLTSDSDSLKFYITRRQAFMFLVNQEEEEIKKLEDIRQKIKKASLDVIDLEKTHPEYNDQWLEVYNKERASIGAQPFVEDEKFRTILSELRTSIPL